MRISTGSSRARSAPDDLTVNLRARLTDRVRGLRSWTLGIFGFVGQRHQTQVATRN